MTHTTTLTVPADAARTAYVRVTTEGPWHTADTTAKGTPKMATRCKLGRVLSPRLGVKAWADTRVSPPAGGGRCRDCFPQG